MSTFRTNDGVEIYYEVRGDGRPLLMLPGWTCSTKFWKKNVEELAKSCKVITMDLRAHGESEKVLHSHRISRYAMDVRNLLEHLDLQDVTGLGWSMGGVDLVELYRAVRRGSAEWADLRGPVTGTVRGPGLAVGTEELLRCGDIYPSVLWYPGGSGGFGSRTHHRMSASCAGPGRWGNAGGRGE